MHSSSMRYRLAAQSLAAAPSDFFERAQREDRLFAGEPDDSPILYELESLDLLRRVIDTSIEDSTRDRVAGAVMSLLNKKKEVLCRDDLEKLHERVRLLPDDFQERKDFMSFFKDCSSS
ncbi:MAG: hypothetical protein S4CHLAM6_03210 [Chlamydiae bacterium]|nr:hypothetical protein [Chlamydiota bacterium]